MKKIQSFIELYKQIRKPIPKKSFAFKAKCTYNRKIKHKEQQDEV